MDYEMKECEARLKICPFIPVIKQESYDMHNRAKIEIERTNCVGSHCMAWENGHCKMLRGNQ